MLVKIQNNKQILLIITVSLLCWGGLLTLKGIWWDDWAWIWQYYISDDFNEYIIPFQNLNKVIEGTVLYTLIKLIDVFKYSVLQIFNILKFIIFTANSILVYFIARFFFTKKNIFPETLAVVFLISPIVNNLCLVTLLYHLELLSFFLSILFSIKAVGKEKINKKYYLFALLFGAYPLMALGSYVFFDVLRLCVVFFAFIKIRKFKLEIALKRSLLFWSPFLLIGAGVIIHTMLYPQSGAYSGAYKLEPISLTFIYKFLARYFLSLRYFFTLYTVKPFYTILKSVNINFLFAIVTTIIMSLYIVRRGIIFKKINQNHFFQKPIIITLLFGIFATLVGIFPYAMVRGSIGFGLDSRHGILANVGVTIFLSALLFMFYKNNIAGKVFSYILLAIVIFSGVFLSRSAVLAYSNDWKQQRTFWWQFAWRVPDLNKDTFLIIDLPRNEFEYFGPWRGAYSLTGPLNLIYAKSYNKTDTNAHFALSMYEERSSVKVYSFEEVYQKDIVEFNAFYGIQKFYPKNLLVSVFRNDYLEINEGITDFQIENLFYNREPYISSFSSNQIIYRRNVQNFPLRWIIGPEPVHNWIYYYQKAMASLNYKDYENILLLYSKIDEQKIISSFPRRNLLPFIISLYQDGDITTGNKLLINNAVLKSNDLEKFKTINNYFKTQEPDSKLMPQIKNDLLYLLNNY